MTELADWTCTMLVVGLVLRDQVLGVQRKRSGRLAGFHVVYFVSAAKVKKLTCCPGIGMARGSRALLPIAFKKSGNASSPVVANQLVANTQVPVTDPWFCG